MVTVLCISGAGVWSLLNLTSEKMELLWDAHFYNLGNVKQTKKWVGRPTVVKQHHAFRNRGANRILK